MRKAGALTALVAGMMGLAYAILTWLLGAGADLPPSDAAQQAEQWLGWAGPLIAGLVVALAALAFKTGSRVAAGMAVLVAGAGAWFGSGPLFVFMAVALAGSVLAVFGKEYPVPGA